MVLTSNYNSERKTINIIYILLRMIEPAQGHVQGRSKGGIRPPKFIALRKKGVKGGGKSIKFGGN